MGAAAIAALMVGCAPPWVTLEGTVRDAYTDEPIAGARVALADGTEALTASDGSFVLRASGDTERLRLTAEGYHAGERVSVRADRDNDAVLFPLVASDEQITAHMMAMGPVAPASVRAAAIDEVGSVRLPLIDRPVDLPETIRVWRSQGTPLAPSAPSWTDSSCSDEAVVEVLPLEEYVKGVIPHEWSPSWHPEALQAGAVAARSFAVGHTLRGGRWDCADVDDGTVTQVYRSDRADSTNDAVEATRGQVVVRDGAIITAEYSAENTDPTAFDVDDPTCTGTTRFGHGRGMCQWGTQRWALGTCANPPCDLSAFGDEPKGYEWMVEHYYPDAQLAGDPADVTPCGTLPPEGGVIDDADACASVFGPATYWRTEAIGNAGALRWTNAFVTATPSNWGRFRIHVTEAGRYALEVYVEPGFGGHQAVDYAVEDADGTRRLQLDQRAASGWTYLLDMRITDTGNVSVMDTATAVDDADKRVVFDAIRLTRLDAPGTDAGVRPGVDAGSPTDADGGTSMTDGAIDGPGRETASGCGCATARRSSPSVALLFVLAGLVLLRARGKARRT